ncbi:MAG: hypothetical protein KJ000_09840 [Pirellulaceae bacterium]|nr:hypothetical protein [Pirellulaceae bacterium]
MALLDVGDVSRQSSLVAIILKLKPRLPLNSLQGRTDVDLDGGSRSFQFSTTLEIRIAFLGAAKFMIRQPAEIEATGIVASPLDGHGKHFVSLLSVTREVGMYSLAVEFRQQRILSSRRCRSQGCKYHRKRSLD